MQMRIAVSDGPSLPSDKAANLARLEHLAAAATMAGAALLVVPQLFLMGFGATAARVRTTAELSDGAAAHHLCGIARTRRVAILCGYVELCTDRLYDSALLVDERGCALANYRRTHFAFNADGEPFTRGQWLSSTPLQGIRAGILIGPDIEAPEPARALALAGAQILLVAAGHGAEAQLVGQALLRTRAFENALAVAYANGAAELAAPRSCLVAPDGTVLASAAAGQLAVADVPIGVPLDSARCLPRRRPRLYQKLAAAIPNDDAPRL